MNRAEDQDILNSVFGDIRQSEARAISDARAQLAAVDAQIVMAQRAASLEHAPGWKEFQDSVAAALKRVTDDLVTTSKSSEYMRQQQGRAQGLRDVLTILRSNASLIAQLQQSKADLTVRIAELFRLAPKQKVESQ